MCYNKHGDCMKSNVISFKVSEKTQEMMSEELAWCMRDKTPQYAKWQAKDGDTVITLYESGKVVFQGKDADLSSDFWITTEKINTGKVDVKSTNTTKSKGDEFVNPYIYNSSSIGSDEVGTGDYFGPIVVCASFVSKENIPYLESLGVKDSKKITDIKILEIVPKIIEKIPHEVYILSNKDYNEKIAKLNLNKIKALLHNHVLFNLKNRVKVYDNIIVDEFAKEYVYYSYLKEKVNVVKGIKFFTKGESKHLSVAVASLIARYYFLIEYQKLEKELGINIPKGASTKVDTVGKIIVDKYGIKKLDEIAKINFKNTEKIKEML